MNNELYWNFIQFNEYYVCISTKVLTISEKKKNGMMDPSEIVDCFE